METKTIQGFSFISESEYAIYFKQATKNVALVVFKEDEIIDLEKAKAIVQQMESICRILIL